MRLGRVQRQCRRAFIAYDGEVLTSQLAEWAWARRLLLERLPITRYQRKSTARAARSIGAVRVKSRSAGFGVVRFAEVISPRLSGAGGVLVQGWPLRQRGRRSRS